jgi:hypothetical protein
MKQQNFHCSITASVTPKEAFDKINRVTEWWAINLDGNSKKLHDVFTVHFGETYVTFKITEFVTGKKVSWYVTDCHLAWQKDKTEWNGTKVVFEISKKDGSTEINFTHIGLVPEVECYDVCEKGWSGHIKDSLLKLLTQGKGSPQ